MQITMTFIFIIKPLTLRRDGDYTSNLVFLRLFVSEIVWLTN